MSFISSFLSAVFWGLLVLSLLVAAHEGGHFLAARVFGMRVTEFFLGLPFRYHLSVKSPRYGTEFGITPILLGGYNRICGMEGNPDDLLAPALAIVQREGRVLASDLARELEIGEERAYDILAVLADMGSIKPYFDPERGEHPWQSDYPAAFETLRRDANMLTEYDKGHDFAGAGTTDAGAPRPVADAAAFLADETTHTYRGKGFFARLVTLAAGPVVNIALAFVLVVGSLMTAGVEVNANSNVLGDVQDDSYAQAAGLRAGDRILQVGNHTVTSWVTLADAIDRCLEAGGDIRIAYERDSATYETTIVIPEGQKVDAIGVVALLETYHPSFPEATSVAVSYVALVARTVARIIMPQHTMEIVSQSSSIVGISAMASEAASSGIADLVMLAAAVSLSLGFMNLLPIPPLDGGKILLEVIQLVTRKPISARTENAVSYLGLAFFLFIFCFAVRNDIVRLLGLG